MRNIFPLTLALLLLVLVADLGRADPPPSPVNGLPGPNVSTPAVQPEESAVPPIVQKILSELGGPITADSKPQPGIPHGERLEREFVGSKIYPGSVCHYSVYVPAQYTPEKPACLVLHLDGIGPTDTVELDNLIASKELPVMIEVGLAAEVMKRMLPTGKQVQTRVDRSYEFDSINDDFPNFVLNEFLPEVERQATRDGRPIRLSQNPDDRMTTGGSSGGIGAFTLAWLRPDTFHRVFTVCGTFVAFRGGNEYPYLVRKTEPKPIRVFVEDGAKDAWNPAFGNWFEQNQELVSALAFAGYDVEYAWGVHGHDGRVANVIRPDVMRWLWRDWPAPVKPGISKNDMLGKILMPDQSWQIAAEGDHGIGGLAANAQGEVFFCDAPERTIYRVGATGTPVPFLKNAPAITGTAFGPDGTLYGIDADNKGIVTLGPTGPGKTVAGNLAAAGVVVSSDHNIYVSEPNQGVGTSSTLWLIKPTGEKIVVDSGLSSASGLAFTPDHSILYAAEENTHWVYSYAVQPDGTLTDKQRFDWLHATDYPSDSGARDLAVDRRGSLYVATRMGIQVCDSNGRVWAILPLPSAGGPALSLCFGGPDFQTLFVTDGNKVFRRKLKVTGYPQWSAPDPVPLPAKG